MHTDKWLKAEAWKAFPSIKWGGKSPKSAVASSELETLNLKSLQSYTVKSKGKLAIKGQLIQAYKLYFLLSNQFS